MGDPVTMMAVGAGVSGIASAGSSYLQYKSAKDQASAARQAAAFNAKIGEEDIAILDDQLGANISAMRRQQEAIRGESIANASANAGLTGSALDVILSNTEAQELDILNMKYDTELEKRSIRNNIKLGNMEARATSRAARLAQAGAILGGVSSLGNSAFKFGQISSLKGGTNA